MYAALNADPSDPDVIFKLDISDAFNALCVQLTLDVLGGQASSDYACGLKEGDNIDTCCRELRNIFDYFRAMRNTKSHLRYHMCLFFFNPSPGRRVPIPNRYTAKAKLCFCKNNKRMMMTTTVAKCSTPGVRPADSKENPSR